MGTQPAIKRCAEKIRTTSEAAFISLANVSATREGLAASAPGRRSLLKFRLRISSVVLVASALCFQAAFANQTPTENRELKAEPSPDINSGQGHKLRLRLLTLEPGGIVNLHSQDRPTVLQVIKGMLTSHPQGQPEIILRAGVGLTQDKHSNFWVQNTGSEPAEFIWLPVYESSP